MHHLESAGLSNPGRKRQNNEDFIALFEPEDSDELRASGCLYIVADGVGGAIRGEKASRYAAQKVLFEYYRHPELSPHERLRESMCQAGNDIYNYAQDNHDSPMATTMVAATIKGDTLTIANVGDSRAYLIRGKKVEQITHDHNLVGEMLRDGLITEAESHKSKVKNLLTRSLGGEFAVHVDIFPEIPLLPGDRILLCSDGLTRYARREDLYALSSQGSSEEVVNKLIAYANHKGGADNISTIFIKIDPVESGQELNLNKMRRLVQAVSDGETIPTQIGNAALPRKGFLASNKRFIPWEIFLIVCLLGVCWILSWKHVLFVTGSPPLSIAPTGIESNPNINIPSILTQSIVDKIITTDVLDEYTQTEPSLDLTIMSVMSTANFASEIIAPVITQDTRVYIYKVNKGKFFFRHNSG
jgi:protein phosphatase